MPSFSGYHDAYLVGAAPARPGRWQRRSIHDEDAAAFDERRSGQCRRALIRREESLQQSQPVPMHDGVDISIAISAFRQHLGYALQIKNGVEICRSLLSAISAIKVGADRRVISVSANWQM